VFLCVAQPTCALLQALSWLFSPILAAVAAFCLFGLIRTFILRSDNAYRRSLVLLPVFVFVTFFTVTWFIIAR
jgi:sodium-dependent phosphate transporter